MQPKSHWHESSGWKPKNPQNLSTQRGAGVVVRVVVWVVVVVCEVDAVVVGVVVVAVNTMALQTALPPCAFRLIRRSPVSTNPSQRSFAKTFKQAPPWAPRLWRSGPSNPLPLPSTSSLPPESSPFCTILVAAKNAPTRSAKSSAHFWSSSLSRSRIKWMSKLSIVSSENKIALCFCERADATMVSQTIEPLWDFRRARRSPLSTKPSQRSFAKTFKHVTPCAPRRCRSGSSSTFCIILVAATNDPTRSAKSFAHRSLSSTLRSAMKLISKLATVSCENKIILCFCARADATIVSQTIEPP